MAQKLKKFEISKIEECMGDALGKLVGEDWYVQIESINFDNKTEDRPYDTSVKIILTTGSDPYKHLD